MSAWGGGGTLQTMPSSPAAPKSLEMQITYLAAQNTNPFTGQQQTIDYQSSFREGSATMPSMVQTDAANWIQFIADLQGPVNVFQFPSALGTAYPETLNNSGSGRYFRLKGFPKWTIKPGKIYGLTFDFREAI